MALKCLPALSFEDADRIKASFSLIVDHIIEVCDTQGLSNFDPCRQRIDELCIYFQKYYVDFRPLFPPQMWNHRNAAFEGLARTTNAVEGWHFGLQAHFTGAHPTIWKLLTALKKDAATQTLSYLQFTAGHSVLPKKYRDINELVQNIMRNYNANLPLSFLKSIAALSS